MTASQQASSLDMSCMDQGETDTNFQRRRDLIAKKKEDAELARREQEDELMEKRIEEYKRQNQLMLEKAQKRKEERAKKDREILERRQERQKKYEDEMAKIKQLDEKRKRERAEKIERDQKLLLKTIDGFDEADSKLTDDEAFSIDKIKERKLNVKVNKAQEEEIEHMRLNEMKAKVVENRTPELYIRRYMSRNEIVEIAKNLHEQLRNLEEEKYIINIQIHKQRYELKEITTRLSEIQKRKCRSARIDQNDSYSTTNRLQDLIAEDSNSESMASTVGSQFSITTNGGVSARIGFFKNINLAPPPSQTLNQNQDRERRGEAIKVIQDRVNGALMKCVACGRTVYHTEMVIINDKSHYHKDCLLCDWCGKIVPQREIGSWSGKFYCQYHLKQALFGTLPEKMITKKNIPKSQQTSLSREKGYHRDAVDTKLTDDSLDDK